MTARQTEADWQAEAARLRAALAEVEPLLSKLAMPARADLRVVDLVEELGDQIGYGALMVTASALWRQRLADSGFPVGGEFSPNICQMTAEQAWRKVCAALDGQVRP